jgi:phosphoglucomutase
MELNGDPLPIHTFGFSGDHVSTQNAHRVTVCSNYMLTPKSKEIEDLLAAGDEPELEKRLRKRIAFGTAGLRSSMKAGFAHMNSYTVLQASQGLVDYILSRQETPQHVSQHGSSHHGTSRRDENALSVAIGHDARHNSDKFAKLAAGVFITKGFHVLWLGEVHTPMVPFTVSHYHAAAGIMVTASHNPKNDNGYKVYWSNGSQIIPPHDKGIAKAIDQVEDIVCWDTSLVDNHAAVKLVFSEAVEAYWKSLRQLASPADASNRLFFTYTPMHGVGLRFMRVVASTLEYQNLMKVVDAQAQPDPEFSTVPFPNPEEKGALDLAIVDATKHGSSIIIANDPDADRFAVAEQIDGRWHQFTGNQMGVLLASHVLETYRGDKSKLAMLASTVSSRMLAAMAKKEGFRFKETLTGFKWLGNVAQDLQKEGFDPAYAYEEAIGYMFPSVVWDKDGIAAAAVFLTAWQRWPSLGMTPWQKLQELYQTYGHFEDANTYLISPSLEITERVFTDIRTSNGGRPPSTIGARKIRRWRDLTVGFDSASPDGKPDLPVDPTAQMITCELGDVVFTVRGSGTEPKIKFYIEGTAESSSGAKAKANEVLQDLLREWFKPEYGLRRTVS